MNFEADVIANPRALIKPIVNNNTADVAHNMKDLIVQDLTKNGVLNVVNQLWDSGQKARVFDILNVAYIDSAGPDMLAEYMAKYAQPGDTPIMAYNRHVGIVTGTGADVKQTTDTAPVIKDRDPGRLVSVAALTVVLLVIFIFYVRNK